MDLDRIVEDLAREAALSHRLVEVVALNLLGLAPHETSYALRLARGTVGSYQAIVVPKCHARSRQDFFRVWLEAHAEPGAYPFGRILEPYKDRLDDVFRGRTRGRSSK